MKNWKIHPKNPLVSQFIDCYWFLEKEPDDSSEHFPKLNPYPATHLILAESSQLYCYHQNDEMVKGFGSHWIFPHRKTILMDHSKPFMVLGIKFHIGALYSLKLSTPQLVLDTISSININELLSSQSFNESDVFLKAAQSPEECCHYLDKTLLNCLSKIQQDNHSKLVRKAVPMLLDQPLSEIWKRLNCSQRTVERSFLKVTGLTLKQHQTMNKLEAMLGYLHTLNPEKIDWSDIAVKFGFSDQPHLTRHLKSSIGATPGIYAKQRDLSIDVYGDFE